MATAAKMPARTRVVSGPTAETTNSASGPFAFARVSVAPPQNTSVIPVTGRPNARAAIACADSWSKTPPKNSTPSNSVSPAAPTGVGRQIEFVKLV